MQHRQSPRGPGSLAPTFAKLTTKELRQVERCPGSRSESYPELRIFAFNVAIVAMIGVSTPVAVDPRGAAARDPRCVVSEGGRLRPNCSAVVAQADE